VGILDSRIRNLRDEVWQEMMDHLQEQQPPKLDATGDDCWLLVIKDMEVRRLHGIEKYGVPVRADSGRDALVDAYQEALDLCVYLRQAIEQRKKV
jgi:hypothetical protein